jgi:hypothetical protein
MIANGQCEYLCVLLLHCYSKQYVRLIHLAVRTAHEMPSHGSAANIMYAGFIYDLRMRAAAVNVFNTVRFLAEVYHVLLKFVLCLRI